jgi:hypothetical protein
MAGIESGPVALYGLMFFSNFSTPGMVTIIGSMVLCGLSPLSGIELLQIKHYFSLNLKQVPNSSKKILIWLNARNKSPQEMQETRVLRGDSFTTDGTLHSSQVQR